MNQGVWVFLAVLVVVAVTVTYQICYYKGDMISQHIRGIPVTDERVVSSRKLGPLGAFYTGYLSQMQRPKNQEIKPHVKYLFYVCAGQHGCGGFSDRLRVVLPLYYITKCLNRTYGIIMQKPRGCPLEGALVPNKVDWLYDDHLFMNYYFRHPDRVAVLSAFTTGLILITQNERKKTSFKELDLQAMKQDIIVITGNLGIGGTPFLDQCRSVEVGKGKNADNDSYNNLFRLSTDLQKKMDTIRNPNYRLICAHVRMRRNPSIPMDDPSINSLSTIHSLFNFLENKLRNSTKNETRLFVASDSVDVTNKARKRFGDNVIIVDGPIVHSDLQGDKTCSGLQKLILDFSILTTCDVFVQTMSGLSRYAAVIGKPEKERYLFSNGIITGPIQNR